MPIRVLLVEDSTVALIILKRILASSSEIIVVGTARTGREALALIPNLQPDVICTDFHMPTMNGLEFTEEVMANFPRPILVISASVQEDDTQNVFQLLNAGAVDVFPKPKTGLASDYELVAEELIRKIKVLSGVKVFTKHRKKKLVLEQNKDQVNSDRLKTKNPDQNFLNPPKKQNLNAPQHGQQISLKPSFQPIGFLGKKNNPIKSRSADLLIPPTGKMPVPQFQPKFFSRIKVIGIGSSTGGPQALHTILSQFPPDFPVPIICVQHISEGFLQGLVNWLKGECCLPVMIAQPGELPQGGTIYFAPERYHLDLDHLGRFIYSSAPPCSGHRPSVTVTLEAIARFYGSSSAGVLLTGMGRDGAEGMNAIAKVGGLTIAQDEASCVVFGMPAEAIALGAAQQILSINAIAPLLLKQLGVGKNS